MLRFLFILVLAGVLCAACDNAPDKAEQADQEYSLKDNTEAINGRPADKTSSPAHADLEPAAEAAATTGREDKTVQAQQPEKEPGEEERAAMEKMIAFYNTAKSNLEKGYFALPHKLLANTRIYQQTWRLPKRPSIPGRKNAVAVMSPAKGLFPESEEKMLAAGLDGMDKAISSLVREYMELDKYVADNTIKDNGDLGATLARNINNFHGQFLQARKSWLEIVEKRASAAEQILLASHPLQRQIIAARNIFVQINEVGAIAKTENHDRRMLSNIRQDLINILEQAQKPPFPANAHLERAYRTFLKNAWSYVDILQTCLDEGFHDRQRARLNTTAIACQKSYNDFVRKCNGEE